MKRPSQGQSPEEDDFTYQHIPCEPVGKVEQYRYAQACQHKEEQYQHKVEDRAPGCVVGIRIHPPVGDERGRQKFQYDEDQDCTYGDEGPHLWGETAEI